MTREELVNMREYKIGQASTEYWNKNMNSHISILEAFEDGIDFYSLAANYNETFPFLKDKGGLICRGVHDFLNILRNFGKN